MLRRLRAAVLVAAVAAPAAVFASAPAAVSLPGQASPSGHEHANTHGPDGADLFDPAAPPAANLYEIDRAAAWSQSEWDGKRFTVDQPDLTTLPTVHAVYVVPKGATDRYLQFAAMFQADAAQANAVLQAETGRSVRFDYRQSATRQLLDITFFRSRYSARQLSASNQFSLVDAELAKVPDFNRADKKYAVWLDADSTACGQGTLYHDQRRSSANSNERRTTGIVYRPYDAYIGDGTTGGFCRGRTLLHELGHNMGALQGAVTPNDFDGAHCDDSGDDVMCYVGAAEAKTTVAAADTSARPELDYGKDDYWDAGASKQFAPVKAGLKLPWWTVNLSRFVCPTIDGNTPDCARPSSPGY